MSAACTTPEPSSAPPVASDWKSCREHHRVSAQERDFENGPRGGGDYDLRWRGCELTTIETSVHSIDLFDWKPRFPVCVMFGHEVGGVRPELLSFCVTHIRLPILGRKHSLNVATAGGVVLYELQHKYRRLREESGQS